MDISRMTVQEIRAHIQECEKEICERNKRKRENLINELREVIKKITEEEGYTINLYINSEEEMEIFDERDLQIELI